MFAIGAATFLITFSWFKYAAMEVFRKELQSNQSIHDIWQKLFKVFFVDFLLCIIGVLVTGVLFVSIYSLMH